MPDSVNEVRPFRALHYDPAVVGDIGACLSQPYDVISPEQRAQLLAGAEHNVVALELPDGPLDASAPGNRYETGAATWNAWIEAGTLVPVSLTVVRRSDSNPLQVEERLPFGWNASSISDGGTQVGNAIRWSLASFTANKTLTYQVMPPAGIVLT